MTNENFINWLKNRLALYIRGVHPETMSLALDRNIHDQLGQRQEALDAELDKDIDEKMSTLEVASGAYAWCYEYLRQRDCENRSVSTAIWAANRFQREIRVSLYDSIY